MPIFLITLFHKDCTTKCIRQNLKTSLIKSLLTKGTHQIPPPPALHPVFSSLRGDCSWGDVDQCLLNPEFEATPDQCKDTDQEPVGLMGLLTVL